MSNKQNNTFFDIENPSIEINNDGTIHKFQYKRSHVMASIESSGATPIDITLMTGNGNNNKEEE